MIFLDWKQGPESDFYDPHKFYIKILDDNHNDSYVALSLKLSPYNPAVDKYVSSYWKPIFANKLYEIGNIYHKKFPTPNSNWVNDGKIYHNLSEPLLKFNKLDDAKKHIDDFLDYINKLKIFI